LGPLQKARKLWMHPRRSVAFRFGGDKNLVIAPAAEDFFTDHPRSRCFNTHESR
jgi:hypothetical protein